MFLYGENIFILWWSFNSDARLRKRFMCAALYISFGNLNVVSYFWGWLYSTKVNFFVLTNIYKIWLILISIIEVHFYLLYVETLINTHCNIKYDLDTNFIFPAFYTKPPAGRYPTKAVGTRCWNRIQIEGTWEYKPDWPPWCSRPKAPF